MKRQYFITQKMRFEKGRAELSGFKALFEIWVLSALAVKFLLNGEEWAFWLIPPALAILCFGMWFIGYLWDKFMLYDEEANFAIDRHAFFKEWKRENDVKEGKNKRVD
jgi:hypothetical protein